MPGLFKSFTDNLILPLSSGVRALSTTTNAIKQLANPYQTQAPSGQELNLARLQAMNAPARQAVQARYAASQPVLAPVPNPLQNVAPRPIQSLTGGIQQQVNPATAQLQQEADNLAKYGQSQAPQQQSQLQQPQPQQEQPQPQEAAPQLPNFVDTYKNIYSQLGLGDVQTQLESTNTQLQDLQNQKVDEISKVNENPWLTEGQRRDRVNAINEKYQLSENNLINRIQLFQSTFEQGRQEAQFLASQTAQDQRAQFDLVQQQLEAQRKLQAQGQEVLSVADARDLGVPYGTTVEEARKLGVIPQTEQKLGPGIVGEYQFYVQQEQAAGRKPLSFNEYQNVDANRKMRIASAANSAGLNSVQTSTALKLSDDFEQATKNFRTVADSYNRVATSATNPSAAGDLSLIFSYMKMLDPTSTVREGEFANAQNAGGIPDKIRSAYNKAANGKRLSENQRTDFVTRATGIYQSELRQQQQTSKTFSDRAQKLGIPSDLVVRDLTATGAPTAPVKGKTSSGLGYTIIP